jgi:hypothetical protein
MALRKPADARELEKLTAAYERAQRALSEGERELQEAERERDEAHERLAADAFCEGSQSVSLNGKADRRVAEAIVQCDTAAAAVRGIRSRGIELAEKVAEARLDQAEAAVRSGRADVRDAEGVLDERRRALEAAESALTEATRDAKYAAAAFDEEAAAGAERARQADEDLVEWHAHNRGIPDVTIPARLRERIEAESERLRAEGEAARKRDHARAIAQLGEPMPGEVRAGESFPRLPR